MAFALNHITYLLTVFVFCLKCVNTSEFIPVYMWETTANYISFPTLGGISQDFFKDILLEKLNNTDVVPIVFAGQSLSPEDFSSYDSSGNHAFPKLSQMRRQTKTMYYPFVEDPMSTFQTLPGYTIKKVSSNVNPKNLKPKPGEIIVVDLNDAQDNEGRHEMLNRHDTIMVDIYKTLISKNYDVVAFFTGHHSSWVVPSEMVSSSRHSRSILAANEGPAPLNGKIFLSSSIIMYAANISYYKAGDKTLMISDFSVNKDKTSNDSLAISSGDLTLEFFVNERMGYWFLESVNGSDGNVFSMRNAYAPERFSFHCNNTNMSTDNAVLFLSGFQIQWSSSQQISAFGDAYDCVGFTSAPIWSGLFITFILVSIMTFGLCMIMDIKTMDRFDDPKGKTISINVSE